MTTIRVPKFLNRNEEELSPEMDFTIIFIQECSDESKIRQSKRAQNIMLKNAIKKAQFRQIGSDKKFFYDFTNLKTIVGANDLRVIPGYKANFNLYQDKILLKIEMSHKLMGTESLNIMIRNLYQRRLGHEEINVELYQKSVLTRLVYYYSVFINFYLLEIFKHDNF